MKYLRWLKVNEINRVKNKIIKYIKLNKPVDLWQDKLDMLNNKEYIDFIIWVFITFNFGKLVSLANELKDAIQKELLE